MISFQVPSDEPRGCFQVLAERKLVPTACLGYENFRGSFHSLADAKVFAVHLSSDDYFPTSFNWVQIADVFHGQVWNYINGEWVTEHYDEDGEVVRPDDEGGTTPHIR